MLPVADRDFKINAGLNDAWVNANAALQGMFITVFPALKIMFVAWFTFDSEQPPDDVTAVFGAAGQRWVTGLGSFDGNRVELNAELTSGGIFNSSDPLATQEANYGSIIIDFSHCNLLRSTSIFLQQASLGFLPCSVLLRIMLRSARPSRQSNHLHRLRQFNSVPHAKIREDFPGQLNGLFARTN